MEHFHCGVGNSVFWWIAFPQLLIRCFSAFPAASNRADDYWQARMEANREVLA
jgi:hypothetical protein